MTDTTTKDDGDWLGYGVYADTLWARIERALAKDLIDGELGDDPMVIGIFGEWGAGKSQLLKLIERRAKANLREQKKKREGDSGFELTVPVWFQPWKYEHEEHLHVPMVIHVLNALKDALKHEATLVDTVVNTSVAVADRGKKAAPLVQKTLEVANNAYPVIQKILKSITVFGCNVDLPEDVGEWLETAADGVSDIDLKNDVKVKISTTDAAVKLSTDGSYFYRIHELLGALTRPHGYKHRKDLFKDANLTLNTRINFVVFIDDLDRCLPEKAVQTLEMIKTIFNVESFAFVLALDDEVIERGIAHRYKDYALVDKKQQMPITGFEYLEKIIHLPFRLPALTISQAERFVRNYEQQIEKDSTLRWFDWMPPKESVKNQPEEKNVSEADIRQENKRTDLLALALSGFDAYVPRKLIRMVELTHQIAKVARERKSPIRLVVNESIDVRVVLVLALIQLFQPELYRIIRRRTESFPFLLAAFSKRPTKFQEELLPAIFADAKVADVDLWRWVADPKNYAHTSDIPWNPGTQDNITNYVVQAIANKDTYNFQDRSDAQQVRLPLVAQIVEHRAAQRHVFDVLKLIKTLAQSMEDTNSKPYQLTFAPTYTTLLTENINQIHIFGDLPPLMGEIVFGLSEPEQPKFAISNPISLAADLLSSDLAVQSNLVGRHNLRELQKIEESSIVLVERELLKTLVSNNDPSKSEYQGIRLNLLNGLQYIAPFVTKAQGARLWSMVQGIIDVDKTPIDPKLRAQWHDVRVPLGQDNRFEGKFALPKRIKGDAPEAPAGFVLCPPIKYIFGDEHKTRIQTKPFYISRYAVTVAQYYAFVAADGYKNQSLWESAHKDAWSWKIGKFDELKNTTAHSYERPLSLRPTDLRHLPMDWAEQLTHRNRPVTGVTWFEATVFAAWLENQREVRDGGSNLWGTLNEPQYRLRLSTEGEWERAARAGGRGAFPWGDEVTNIDQLANVGGSVGKPTTVGSYNPNALGLYDMAGNVWQWQANLYTNPYENRLVLPRTPLEINRQTVEAPALRGGSWREPHESSQSSDRDWNHPGIWSDNIGFRLVLSLIDSEA